MKTLCFGRKASICIGTASVVAAMIFSACGTKKKANPSSGTSGSTPVLNNDDDATGKGKNSEWAASVADLGECNSSKDGNLSWVADIKKLHLCHDGEWIAVIQDPVTPTNPAPTPQPVGPLMYLVMDGNGAVIGRTDFSGYLKSLDQSAFSFQLKDAGIFKVNPINGGFSGEQCVYAETDCSGACLYQASAGQKNKIIQGTGGFYKISGAETVSAKSYSAYTLGDFPSPVCSALGSTQTGALAEMAGSYTFPEGVTYPISAPITVRAE